MSSRVDAAQRWATALVVGLIMCGCGGADDAATDGRPAEAEPNGSSTAGPSTPPGLTDEDRRLLDASIGPGAAERVAAAAVVPGLCDALEGAVDATEALSSAEGDDLVRLVGSAQAPIAAAADAMAAAGLERTAAHWSRYRDALTETMADLDLADQASRDRANLRFRTVKAMGAGSTETELGAVATVCGLA